MPRPPAAPQRLRLPVDRGDDGHDHVRLLRRADRARTAGPQARVAVPAGGRAWSRCSASRACTSARTGSATWSAACCSASSWLLVLGIAYRRHVARSFWMRPLALAVLRRVRDRRAVACAARDRSAAGALRAAAADARRWRTDAWWQRRLGARCRRNATSATPRRAGRWTCSSPARWRRCRRACRRRAGGCSRRRTGSRRCGLLDDDTAAARAAGAAGDAGRPGRSAAAAARRRARRRAVQALRLWPAPARLRRRHAAVARQHADAALHAAAAACSGCGCRVADDGAAHARGRAMRWTASQLREVAAPASAMHRCRCCACATQPRPTDAQLD